MQLTDYFDKRLLLIYDGSSEPNVQTPNIMDPISFIFVIRSLQNVQSSSRSWSEEKFQNPNNKNSKHLGNSHKSGSS